MAKSVTSVLTLFRHALIALGENPPHAKAKVLEHAAEVFGFNVQPLRTVLELRSGWPRRRQCPELVSRVHGRHFDRGSWVWM